MGTGVGWGEWRQIDREEGVKRTVQSTVIVAMQRHRHANHIPSTVSPPAFDLGEGTC